MRISRSLAAVLAATVVMLGTILSQPAMAAGTGTTCHGTIWAGGDLRYDILRIKNCSTANAWVVLDHGTNTFTFPAICLRPGGTYSVDRTTKAGPIASSSGIAQTGCIAGSKDGFGRSQVAWGAKSLGFNG